MFVGYQNNEICFIAKTREELENLPCVILDKIEETDKEIIKKNGRFYFIEDVPEESYIEQRTQAYPKIEEQLDMIYWDKVNGTDIWQQTIASIKAKYPKPLEQEDV